MKSKNALPKPALLAALLLSVVVPARADITIFTDEAMFLSAVSATGTDRFDDLPATELDSELSRTAGVFGYRVSAGPGEGGFFPVTNEGDLYLAPALAADVVRFNGFSPGVFGFGGSFFATDAYGSYVPGRTIELTAMGGSSRATYTLDGSVPTSFLGFLSTAPLIEVSLRTIGEQGNIYWATANNVVLAVPEPSAYAMFLVGAGIAACAVRRQRGLALASAK
jgi:hypothetical protein